MRRPFYQKDQALAQRDQALSERDDALEKREQALADRDCVQAERDQLYGEDRHLTWFRHRPVRQLAGHSAVTGPQHVDDAALVERVRAAYRAANSTPLGAPDSFWLQSFAVMKRPIHDALMKHDEAALQELLRNPAGNELFHGFETLTKTFARPEDQNWREWIRQWTYDNLLRLAEAIGAWRIDNPESVAAPIPEPDHIIHAIDALIGFRMQFPNPFPDEVGLLTSRGVASHRAVQAMFQAYRVAELVKHLSRPKVLEIGGGLGRTAFFAWQFGIRDYTIIDIPMTSVAQGYFLGRTLGPDAVQLFGENGPGVRILPPSAFLDLTDRYDLVVNVDSLTEMAHETALAYCRAIKTRGDVFLSINHESNAFTVRGVCEEVGMPGAIRSAYWMRRGYVDELFKLQN